MKNESVSVRPYRQTARAQASIETGERIVDSFLHRLKTDWIEDIRLDDIAADANVTVQTVIRRFGGKEGLLDACLQPMSEERRGDRMLPVGNTLSAIDAVLREYEQHGDFTMRLLAQEDRHPAMRVLTDFGRADHRRWIGEVFEPWLSQLDRSARTSAHDRLVIALDVYVWAMVRRNMKRSKSALRETMLLLCAAALRVEPETLRTPLKLEKANA